VEVGDRGTCLVRAWGTEMEEAGCNRRWVLRHLGVHVEGQLCLFLLHRGYLFDAYRAVDWIQVLQFVWRVFDGPIVSSASEMRERGI
jgi:hypothetical protein